MVNHNNSGTTQIGSSTVTVLPNVVNLHPASSGAEAVVRWTAPATATYTVDGFFEGVDFAGPTTTDVHVLLNSSTSAELLSQTIHSYLDPVPIRFTLALSAGDTIDFVVGNGGNGYSNDITALVVTISTTSGGTAVSWPPPTALDLVDGAIPVICLPSSGSIFPLGTTPVTCVATDAHGNASTQMFSVVVQDTTPPLLSGVPSGITMEATSAAGAVVTWATPTASDFVDSGVPVTCLPASGSPFAFGPTLVTCSATDSHGNAAHADFTVRVVDTTGPSLALPISVVVEATSPLGAAAAYAASATDVVSGTVPTVCAPVSGSGFALGLTVVSCSATDGAGNVSTGEFPVIVRDATAPVASITLPSADALLSTSPTAVTVHATDIVGVASVSVNGTPATLSSGSPQDGKWSASVPIAVGIGVVVPFSAVARDASGNATEARLVVDNDGIAAALDRDRANGRRSVECLYERFQQRDHRRHDRAKRLDGDADARRTAASRLAGVAPAGPTAPTGAHRGLGPGRGHRVWERGGDHRLRWRRQAAHLQRCRSEGRLRVRSGDEHDLRQDDRRVDADCRGQVPHGDDGTQSAVDDVEPELQHREPGDREPGQHGTDPSAGRAARCERRRAGGRRVRIAAGGECRCGGAADAAGQDDAVRFHVLRGLVPLTMNGRTRTLAPGEPTVEPIDRTPPAINIRSPRAEATFTVGQTVAAAFACVDADSGVATCEGTSATGQPIATATVGTATFAVTASDHAGNAETASVPYAVTYAVERLDHANRAVQRGATMPIAIRLVDARGVDRSSAEVEVTAQELSPADGSTRTDLKAAAFRFDGDLGGYRFDLETKDRPEGSYKLTFGVTGDPVLHEVEFRVP